MKSTISLLFGVLSTQLTTLLYQVPVKDLLITLIVAVVLAIGIIAPPLYVGCKRLKKLLDKGKNRNR